MASNRINLEFGTSYDGAGLDRLNSGLKSHAGTVSRTIRSVSGLTDALGNLGGNFGKVGGQVSQFASMFLAGGVFGAVSAAISGTVALATKLGHAMVEASKAGRQGFEEWAKASDGAVKRMMATLDRLAKKRKDAEDAERSAKEAAAKRDFERQRKDGAFDFQSKYERAKMALDFANQDDERQVRRMGGGAVMSAEANVRKEQRMLDFMNANRWKYSLNDVKRQEEVLKRATEDLADARAEAAEAAIAAEIDAKVKAKEAADAEAKKTAAAKAKAEADKNAVAKQKAADLKNAELDAKLLTAKEEAAKVKAANEAARGLSFEEWDRQQKDQAKADRKAAEKEAKNLARAEGERTMLARRLFRRDGRMRQGASESDKRRLADLNRFIDAKQNRNDAADEVKRLEAAKKLLMEQTKAELEKIRKSLTDATL